MKCPNCDELLVMTERQAVEIDYCPKCRGVWLDKGELDKIIGRAAGAESDEALKQNKNRRNRQEEEDDDDDDEGGFFNRGKKGNDRGGFLGNLFDF